MNTTLKGDIFESKSYDFIQSAIKNQSFGLIANHCKVYQKKGYYSKDREANIIFDLTIEVWPPGADRYSLLYIIECKSYKSSVPASDIEEFLNKISQVSGVNTKGVFISDSSYEKGAYNLGKNRGLMLVETRASEDFNIILHNRKKQKTSSDSVNDENSHLTHHDLLDNIDGTLSNLLSESLKAGYRKHIPITGLKRLSSKDIENITIVLLNEFNETILRNHKYFPVQEFLKFLNAKFNVKFDFDTPLTVIGSKGKMLGCYNKKLNIISIDPSIVNTPQFNFVLAHEIGHLILHNELKINQDDYDNFKDSEFNYRLDRHVLSNDRNWIEWQANQFAAFLLMPTLNVMVRLVEYQYEKGIRNKGTIYYDYQRWNIQNYKLTISYLADYFKVSKSPMIYKLKDMGVIKENTGYSHWTKSLVKEDSLYSNILKSLDSISVV